LRLGGSKDAAEAVVLINSRTASKTRERMVTSIGAFLKGERHEAYRLNQMTSTNLVGPANSAAYCFLLLKLI
jgi:hypothetical protein